MAGSGGRGRSTCVSVLHRTTRDQYQWGTLESGRTGPLRPSRSQQRRPPPSPAAQARAPRRNHGETTEPGERLPLPKELTVPLGRKRKGVDGVDGRTAHADMGKCPAVQHEPRMSQTRRSGRAGSGVIGRGSRRRWDDPEAGEPLGVAPGWGHNTGQAGMWRLMTSKHVGAESLEKSGRPAGLVSEEQDGCAGLRGTQHSATPGRKTGRRGLAGGGSRRCEV